MKLKPFNRPAKLRGSLSAHPLTCALFSPLHVPWFLLHYLCCLCHMSSGVSFPQYVPHLNLLKYHLLKEAFLKLALHSISLIALITICNYIYICSLDSWSVSPSPAGSRTKGTLLVSSITILRKQPEIQTHRRNSVNTCQMKEPWFRVKKLWFKYHLYCLQAWGNNQLSEPMGNMRKMKPALIIS